MSDAPRTTPTTAGVHGPRWGARAEDWADLAAGLSAPAWRIVADECGIEAGMRVLDIGCGSGEFCRLAARRGAEVSGIDAAEGMIEVARRRLPHADLRIGAMEMLPWGDAVFDVVTGFNAFQFASEIVHALAEARRVARPGGRVAICSWGRREENQMFAVVGSLRELQPPPRPGPAGPDPPAIGEPGVLEGLAEHAGLRLVRSGEVDVPFIAPDDDALARALAAPGSMAPAIAHSGEAPVLRAIVEAAAPFRRPDGSYRIENRFRYVVCTA